MSDQPATYCPNCGTTRPGRFCPECGQKDQPLRQSVRVFLRNAFNEYFGLDGRLWRTLRALIFQPGRLTTAYVAGKRTSFIPPLRLYLTATLLFFFLLSVLDPAASLEEQVNALQPDSTMTASARLAEIEEEVEAVRMSARAGAAEVDSARAAASELGPGADSTLARARATVDTNANTELAQLAWQQRILTSLPPDTLIQSRDIADAAQLLHPDLDGEITLDLGPGDSRNRTVRRLKNARTTAEQRAALSDLVRELLERVPLVLFLMLPIFALIMKVVYIRRDWYYSEHLVFALHNHAIAFLGFSAIALWIGVAGRSQALSIFALSVFAGLAVYLFLAQKRAYGQGVFKTLIKYLLVGALYWAMVGFWGTILTIILTITIG